MTRWRLLVVWGFLLIALLLRFYFYFSQDPKYKPGEFVSIVSTLYSEPSVKGNTQRFQADGISIFAPQFPAYHFGDRLRITGKISPGTLSNSQHNVLIKKRPVLTMYFPKIESKDSPALAFLGTIRQHMFLTITSILPSNQAALLSGIVIGSKEGFSERFKEALVHTGTLHVVVASGMNVSMLGSFLMTVLIRFVSRRLAAVLIIVAIIFYAFLASLEPSIIRASIMGIITFSASALNRQRVASIGLVLACIGMLLFSPGLIFDIGFQLSFAATAGLLFITPVFEASLRWFVSLKRILLIGDGLTTTIVAQLATLPILLFHFGSFSIISILVNALVLWTVPVIMILGGIGSMLTFAPALSYPFFLAALPFVTFFEVVVSFFNRAEFLINVEIPLLVSVGYYFLLISLYALLRTKI